MTERRDARSLPRTGARCSCQLCLAVIGPLERRVGKRWAANYGEPTRTYRQRYVAWHHLAEHLARQGYAPSTWPASYLSLTKLLQSAEK